MITRHRIPELRDSPGIYAVLRHETVHVSAPADVVASIRQWQPTTVTVTDANWWHLHLPDWEVLGPSIHGFTDASPSTSVQPTELRIEPITPGRLRDLQSTVDRAEWGESGFAGGDVELAWRATDDAGRTVAAANLTPFDGQPADVGVLTDPGARGRGAATTVAAVATTYAVQEFGIARWRALSTNRASLRIAERLGFIADCRQIALRPRLS
ncbi:GNAT family N-acetyltransferase [Microlunatus soli]|uniref:GNAT family N-acetyltransferase n=1 Tax=Microlunatus soli TaxID=630515 RepID=UPI0012FC8AEE|nr:GNAT family N-acetyltransferase [Microlunatus soli]